MQTVTVTLQQAYSSNPIGPFTISGGTPQGDYYLLDENVAKDDLLTGRTYNTVTDDVTRIIVANDNGTCANSIEIYLSGATNNPTPTPTPTPTATALPTYTFQLYCTQDSINSPVGGAPVNVVFSASELGFIPVQGVDYITISGAPNVDFIYEFSGVTGEAETSHTFLAKLATGEFTCDGALV